MKDHSAVKFEVAEALGEWMNCLYLKGTEEMTPEQFDHTFIHHKHADGMSGLKKIFLEEGHKINQFPGLKNQDCPGIFGKMIALFKYIRLTKKIALNWLFPRKDMTGIPDHFLILRIGKEKIEKLNAIAKSQKVSTNALLMLALDQATREHLLVSGSERKWILPLNMRPKDKANEIDGNYSASIVLNFKNTPNASEVHEQIKNYLNSKIHWGSFIYSNMARFIGFKGTLKVARSIKEVGTGVFSNLGAWPNDFVTVDETKINVKWRAALAPSTQILPVAATAWQWKETLTLTLQLHPSLALPHDTTEKLGQSWLRALGLEPDHMQRISWSTFPEAPVKP